MRNDDETYSHRTVKNMNLRMSESCCIFVENFVPKQLTPFVNFHSKLDNTRPKCIKYEHYSQDHLCHDNQGGLMWTMLGDMYGHPVHSNIWESTNRFCYRDNYHPEFPKLLTGDLTGR